MDAISGHASREVLPPLAAKKPALDLLYVRGPQVARLLSEQLLSRLEDHGMAVGTYGLDNRVIKNKFLKRVIDERLGATGHIVLGGHGGAPDNPRNRVQRAQKHQVQLNASEFGTLPTETLVHWIHRPKISGDWSARTAHLLACNAEAVIASIPPGCDTWKGGYTIVYGSGSMGASSTTTPSLEAALDYVAECSANDKSPHPLVAFARAGLARVEGLTVIGGDLEGAVSFSAPQSLDELAVTDLGNMLEGAERDVMRVRAALALDGTADFHPDPKARVAAYLFARVLNGDVDAVREALDAKPELIDTLDANNYSLLHLAVDAGQAEVVRCLVERGARLEHDLNADGNTPLMMAAVAGHKDIVALLLAEGADAARQRNGRGATAAELADANGEPELARLLRAEAEKRRTGQG